MTQTPAPRWASSGKILGFLIGGVVLVGAVGAAYFADGGSAGRGMTPPSPNAVLAN